MAPPRRCQYRNCPNTSGTHSLFRFPVKDKNRLRIWVNNSGNIELTSLTPDELKYRHLCEMHFDPCYKNQNEQQKRLVGTAIPRHHHCEDESIDVISSVPVCERPMEVTGLEVTPETSPKKLKVLTPKHVYGKRTFQVLERQETGSSSISSQFEHEMNMPSPKKIKRDNSCKREECIKRKKMLHAAQVALKNKKAHIKRLKTKLEPKNLLQKQKFSSTNSKLLATIQMRQKNSKWTKEEKRFSLALFYKSPGCFNFLRDQGVVLPSVSSIKRWLSKKNCFPGVTKETFQQIKLKFENATLMEKACVLTFDEMSIMTCLEYNHKFDFIEGFEDFGHGERTQKIAKYALVFLARGIYSNWKIPLCYFLSNTNVKKDKLQTLIKEIINKLFDAGLLPKATVCDQVSTNQSALKELGASKDNPFFYVNGRKLFSIFDVPHCLKNLRNNWLYNNYVYEKKEVSFKDVIRTYNIDKNNKSRTLLKITPSHLCPNPFQKMKVKLATQIFSHSVGAAIKTAIKTKELVSPTAENTAEFIFAMNDLFDALNSKTRYNKNPNKCGLMKDNAPREAIRKGLKILENLEKLAIGGNSEKKTTPFCFKGLQQSCEGLLQLLDEENTEGIEYLLTNRFNQDVLENLFSLYRLKGGNNKNPTAKSLRSIFRSYLTEMLVQLPGNQNCEQTETVASTCDLSELPQLSSLEDSEPGDSDAEDMVEPCPQLVELAPTPGPSRAPNDAGPSRAPDDAGPARTPDDAPIENAHCGDTTPTLEQCSVTYFAGWLAKTCSDKFMCEKCLKSMTKNIDLNDKKQLFIIEKTYGPVGSSKLKCPSDIFYKIVDVCLTNYETTFETIKHELNLKKIIIKKLKSVLKIDFASTINKFCTKHLSYVFHKLIETKINFQCKCHKRNLIQNQQKLRLLQNK